MSAKSMTEIAALLEGLRFRKKLIGGVDEADVWRQLDMLQKEYRAAFDAQEAKYEALLNERNSMILQLKRYIAGTGDTHREAGK